MESLKIPIASDHAGFKLKAFLINKLNESKLTIVDYGTNSEDSCDYPDFIHPLANDISNNKYNLGIIICGSANGVSMTANKHKNVRAALCWNESVTEMARMHNNANIIALPARYLEEEYALKLVKIFLNTPFEGGRHEKRVNKINI